MISSSSKYSTTLNYRDLTQDLMLLLENESDWLANFSNFTSLVYHSLPDINWCGFYLLKQNELVLGPFQGKPACIRISMNKGVCGTSAYLQKSVIVDNVHTFPGHIACDAESKSEIVIPLLLNNKLFGVLDIDSPIYNRFTDTDAEGLNKLCTVLMSNSDCLPF